MSDIPNQNAPAVVKAQPVSVSHAQALFDTDKFVQMQRAAQALMHSTVLPESIRGNTPEQCFSNLMVAFDLADRLRTTPISVTQCMSIVHGKILLEGKLVQAAIDNVLGIELYPWWTGERGTDGYRIYLSDKPWDDFTDEQMEALKPGQSFRDRKVVDGSVGEWKTYGKDGRTPKPAWIGIQTQNQLLYRATREWARRYAPTIMLGVYTDDEIDAAEERRIDRGTTGAPRIVAGLSGGFSEQTAQAKPEVEDAKIEEAGEVMQQGISNEEFLRRVSLAFERGEAGEAPAHDLNELISGLTAEQQEEVIDANKEGFDKHQAQQAGASAGITLVSEADEEQLTEEQKADLLAEARSITSQGKSFAINMAWPEEFIAELEAACEEGSAEYDAQVAADVAAEQVKEWSPVADEETEVQTQVDLPNDDQAEATDHSPEAGNMIEGDATPSAVELWSAGLSALTDWSQIKKSIYDLSTSPIWQTLTVEETSEVRRLAWDRMNFLIENTPARQDFLEDLTAFRCWIEWYPEAEGIAANWIYMQEHPNYRALKAEQKRSMVAAVEARIEALGGLPEVKQ